MTSVLIPARAGSRGVPGKNHREFKGLPLWGHAAIVAEEAGQDWYVSTDDPLILGAAGPAGIPRPPELAEDTTPMLDVVKHFLTVVPCDRVVLLQPTQPLRRVEHVREALEIMERTGADSVVSVAEIPAHMSPDYACWLDSSGLVIPDGPSRRQDCRPAYYRDGTVYVLRRDVIEHGSLYGEHVVPLVIPPGETCSIDTEEDWRRAEAMA